MPNRALIAAVAALACIHLGACAGTGSNFDADDAISTMGSALSIASSAAGIASGMGGGGYSAPRPTYTAPRQAYTPPPSNGYSQKGAFDDCARLYGSAGMEAQARACRQRSVNMGSLR